VKPEKTSAFRQVEMSPRTTTGAPSPFSSYFFSPPKLLVRLFRRSKSFSPFIDGPRWLSLLPTILEARPIFFQANLSFPCFARPLTSFDARQFSRPTFPFFASILHPIPSTGSFPQVIGFFYFPIVSDVPNVSFQPHRHFFLFRRYSFSTAFFSHARLVNHRPLAQISLVPFSKRDQLLLPRGEVPLRFNKICDRTHFHGEDRSFSDFENFSPFPFSWSEWSAASPCRRRHTCQGRPPRESAFTARHSTPF